MICPECRYEYSSNKAIHLSKCPVCKSNFIDSTIDFANPLNPLHRLRDAIYYLGDECLNNKELLLSLVENLYKEEKELQKLLTISINEDITIKMYQLLEKYDRNEDLELIKSVLMSNAFLTENASKKIVDSWSFVLDYDENENTIRRVSMSNYVNSKGEIVHTCRDSNFILKFSEGWAYVEEYRDKYYVNIRGQKTLDLQKDLKLEDDSINLSFCTFGEFHNGLATFFYKMWGGSGGFIDKKGNLVIGCKYEKALPFFEGLSAVQLDGLWGFIDTKGKQVIKHKYDKAYSFTEGLALVKGNDNWTFVDRNGKIVHSLKNYTEVEPFFNGFAKVKNEKIGFIDLKGNVVIPLIYEEAQHLQENCIAVKLDKWGMIDYNNKVIIPFEFDEIQLLNKELIVVSIIYEVRKFEKINKCGLYSASGERLLDNNYLEISMLDFDVLLIAELFFDEFINYWGEEDVLYNTKLRLYNITSRKIVETEFDKVKSFVNDLAVFKKGDYFGYIDKNCVEVITSKFRRANDFFGNCAIVSIDFVVEGGEYIGEERYDDDSDSTFPVYSIQVDHNLYSVINRRGDFLVKSKFFEVSNFKKGLSYARIYSKGWNAYEGYINSKGRWVYSEKNRINGNNSINQFYKYDKVRAFSEGLMAVCFNDKWGYVDMNGNETIGLKYEKVSDFQDGLARVKHYSTLYIASYWSLITKNGNYLTHKRYIFIGEFKDEFAVVAIFNEKQRCLFGCINEMGIEIIPLIYDGVKSVKIFDNLYCVKKNKGWGFIDIKGNVIIDFKYDKIGFENEGLALVSNGSLISGTGWIGTFGLIDEFGNEVISDFESIGFMPYSHISNNYLVFDFSFEDYISFLENYTSSYIGDRELSEKYENDFWKANFYDGVTRYSVNRKYGLIDINGKVLRKALYTPEEISSYIDILDDTNYYYMEPILFDYIWKPEFGLFKVRRGINFGFINTKGEEVVECKYQMAENFLNGISKVNLGGEYEYNDYNYRDFKGGKWGFVNLKGEIQIPIEFDEIDYPINGIIKGRKGFIVINMDLNGKVIEYKE